jgi:YVTN family beta-propeller protein
LTFMIQGVGGNALGANGSGLGYGGIGTSLAVEVDNQQGTGDANANHIAVLTQGDVTTHLASWPATWDLENGSSHTMWLEYDGPANQLRVYAAQGVVTTRPASPVLTLTVDLPALVGSQAWFGFSGGTGAVANNHDIESWTLALSAFSLPVLPASPTIVPPGNQTSVVSSSPNLQMQGSDPNGDLLTWSATGLPNGLSINPSSGLISGTPTLVGVFNPTVTATDGATTPATTSFTWTINNVLTLQPLSGTTVPAGTSVALNALSSGGLNPQYRWSFGDGTPDTSFSSSPSTAHVFASPGRFLVTVTARDATGREVTSSYRQAVNATLAATRPTASSSIIYERRTGANSRLWVVNPDNDSVSVFDAVTRAKLAEVNVGRAPRTLALAPDGRVWVANAESATISLLSSTYAVVQTINLPRGSRPYGVVFDPAGANAYVALEDAGTILKLNPTTGATLASLSVGLHVRHLSVTADGVSILAPRFVTPRLPGEETTAPQTTVGGVKYGGEVLVIAAGTFDHQQNRHSRAQRTARHLQLRQRHPELSGSGRHFTGWPERLGAFQARQHQARHLPQRRCVDSRHEHSQHRFANPPARSSRRIGRAAWTSTTPVSPVPPPSIQTGSSSSPRWKEVAKSPSSMPGRARRFCASTPDALRKDWSWHPMGGRSSCIISWTAP